MDIRDQIKNINGDVAMIGCSDVLKFNVVYNLCKRYRKMLHTYTVTEADEQIAERTRGTYHIVRKWTGDVDTSNYTLIIDNQ
jgi:hypothetical protein